VKLRVPALELSTSQARELSCQATRVTQKVKEAAPTCSISKGKGKAKVDDELLEEAKREELWKLKAKRVVIQAMIDQLEG
jgi:hypothetical protein